MLLIVSILIVMCYDVNMGHDVKSSCYDVRYITIIPTILYTMFNDNIHINYVQLKTVSRRAYGTMYMHVTAVEYSHNELSDNQFCKCALGTGIHRKSVHILKSGLEDRRLTEALVSSLNCFHIRAHARGFHTQKPRQTLSHRTDHCYI